MIGEIKMTIEHLQTDATSDAQKCGRWMICSDGYYPYCSECGQEPQSGLMTDLCPNCGVKMHNKE